MNDDKIESSVASDDAISVSMDGGDKTVENRDTSGYVFEDDQVTRRGVQAEAPEADDVDAQGEDTDPADEVPEVELQDLGEFSDDRADEFDAYYRNDEGGLSEDILTAEFDANKASGEAGLNESTYAYLESRHGVSKEMAKKIEASLEAQRNAATTPAVDQRSASLVKVAGGDATKLAEALKWAKESGTYDATAQKRFNAATTGKDDTAATEAVELLMARYTSAKGSELPEVPQRDVTNGTAKPGGRRVKGFKSRQEWREARRAATESGNRKKMDEVNARLSSSDRSKWDD